MSSTTYQRDSSLDKYTVLSSFDAGFSTTEKSIVQALVQKDISGNISGNTYRSPNTGSEWNVKQIDSTLVNTSAPFNYPSATVTESSVIYSEFQPDDVSYNFYTDTSINALNSPCIFTSKKTSSVFYDSNYVFDLSYVADCSDNKVGDTATATFDLTDNKINMQYAVQSRYNTKLSDISKDLNYFTNIPQDPMAISQDSSFNTTKALGMQGYVDDTSYNSMWADISNNVTGEVKFNMIDASYQPNPNGLLITKRNDYSFEVNNDVGIFKIVTENGSVNTISTSEAYDGNTYTDQNILKGPIFNEGATIAFDSSKNDLLLPDITNTNTFKTLFDNPSSEIGDGYTFTVDISTNVGSGYNVMDANDLVHSENNENLLDNLYYMKNYVDKTHNITLSNSNGTTPIKIDTSSNGYPGDANLITIDLSMGEVLDSSHNQNGLIGINTRTPATRAYKFNRSTTDISSVVPYVYYDSDTSSNSINSNQQNSIQFDGAWQKVAQQTSNAKPSDYLHKNNNAILSLYAGSLVNDIIDPSSNVSFTFSSGNITSPSDVHLWKLSTSTKLVDNRKNDVFLDPSYTSAVNGFEANAILTNVTSPPVEEAYRAYVVAKLKSDLGLNSAITTGWALNYTNSDTYLKSSSTKFVKDGANLPAYNDVAASAVSTKNILGGTNLYFKYNYGLIQTIGTKQTTITDAVHVTYATDFSFTQNVSKFDIQDISASSITPSYSYADVSGIYTILATGGDYSLKLETKTYTYDASFSPNYGPYTNLRVTVTGLTKTISQYVLKTSSGNTIYIDTTTKDENVSWTDPAPTNFGYVVGTITSSNSLTITGTFSSNDLKPNKVKIQGLNSGGWNDLSILYDIDMYDGYRNSFTLTAGGNVLLSVTLYEPSLQPELNAQYYYIPLFYNTDLTDYVLQYYQSDASGLSTVIGNSFKYLDIQDPSGVYNVIENRVVDHNRVGYWNNNQYKIKSVTVSDTNVTTIIVSDMSNNEVFRIVLQPNIVFLGNFYVSYIPQDIYRAKLTLDDGFTEGFNTTSYASGKVSLTNIPGVQLQNGVSSTLNTASIPLGAYEEFSVYSESVTLNATGTGQSWFDLSGDVIKNFGDISMNYHASTLTFKNSVGNLYSAVFTLPKYRGYHSYDGNQYYTINRGKTTATFTVDGSGSYTQLSQNISTSVNYSDPYTVSDLRNVSNQTCANLGYIVAFNYSIPPTMGPYADIVIPVNVVGDTVIVDISNNNAVGPYKTFQNSTTLNTYTQSDVYTFSGSNWNSTGYSLSIRPSRIKLRNTGLPSDSFRYQIKYNVGTSTAVYKAETAASESIHNIWFGNPATHNTWGYKQTYTASDLGPIGNGIAIGNLIIKQKNDVSIGTRTVYVVSVPPYYKYEQVSINNATVPYNYQSGDLSANIAYRYMPVVKVSNNKYNQADTFNPYTQHTHYGTTNWGNGIIYGNKNGNLHNSGTTGYLNNVTFKINNIDPYEMTQRDGADSVRHGFIVKGIYMTVSSYLGLYSNNNSGGHTNPIYRGFITDIPLVSNVQDVSSNPIVFDSMDASGGINFRMAQFPADIGYMSGNAGYQSVFQSNNVTDYYNIDMNIGNPVFYQPPTPTPLYFDFKSQGYKPILYTVLDVNNLSGDQIDNVRRVYKYTGVTSIDIDTDDSQYTDAKSLSMTFSHREYYDTTITGGNFGTGSNQIWNYNTVLNNTIVNGPISWTTDNSFNSTVYAGWQFGNRVTATNLPISIFSLGRNQQKWTFVGLQNYVTLADQFHLPRFAIGWDGSVVSPLVNTNVVTLGNQLLSANIANNAHGNEKYSSSSNATSRPI